MKIFIFILCVFWWFIGCQNQHKLNVDKQEITAPITFDTIQSEIIIDTLPKKETIQVKRKKNKITTQKIEYTRYLEFPGDANFNGKPLTEQLDLPKMEYQKLRDTLKKIAIQNYQMYKSNFPKAISDNFEEGISTEHIIYPKKLHFHFQLFENSYAAKPYANENVTVYRNNDGSLFAE